MHVSHVTGEIFSNFVTWEFYFLQESVRYTDEGILGPLMEPVNTGAVDERGELTSSDSEFFTNWGEAQT
jgi:hypothetical protein